GPASSTPTKKCTHNRLRSAGTVKISISARINSTAPAHAVSRSLPTTPGSGASGGRVGSAPDILALGRCVELADDPFHERVVWALLGSPARPELQQRLWQRREQLDITVGG